jgi:serine/threonine-protein kinase
VFQRWGKFLAAAALAVLTVGSATAVADAAPTSQTRVAVTTSTVRDVATLLCLDSNTSGNVYTLGCNGGNFQNWRYQPASNSTVVDFSTGLCLDSNTSGNVYTLRCNGGTFQRWAVRNNGGTLVNIATLRCLDSNTDGHVYTLPCNGGNFQHWYHG